MIQTSQRFDDIRDLIFSLQGKKEITAESRLKGDLDMDSLDMVELVMSMEEHFDIEVPDNAGFDIEGFTVGGILAFMDRHLGPEYPTDGLLTLTDDQFINRYLPEMDEQDGYFRQREWRNDADVPALSEASANNRCWTAVTDDNGDFCIVEGNRLVDRIYHIITSHPLEDPAWQVQVPEEVGPRILCDVEWDTTEEVERTGIIPDLPKQAVVRLHKIGTGEMTEDDTDSVADYLSNEYGFLVRSFTWRDLAEGEEVEL